MKLRLWGTEVRFSLTLLPFLFAGIAAGETDALACTVVSLLLHECAHALAARNLGFGITRLAVYPFGALMHLDSRCAPPEQTWAVAVAGPLGSFLTAAVARLCGYFLPQTDWLDRFAGVNLAIALWNLLPAFPLDGGRLARQLLLRTVRERTANRILLILTCIIATGMLGVAIWLLLHGIAAWMLLTLPVMLVAAAMRECRESTMGPVRHAIDRQNTMRAGQPVKATIIAVSPHTTVGEALQAIRPTRYTVFHVTDGDRSADLEESRLLSIASQYGCQIPLQKIFVFDQSKNPCYTKLFKHQSQIGADQ